jgi:hypothetical protein
MAHPRQLRNLIFGLGLGAATAALAIAFMLTVVASQQAQAQTFNVIYNSPAERAAETLSNSRSASPPSRRLSRSLLLGGQSNGLLFYYSNAFELGAPASCRWIISF